MGRISSTRSRKIVDKQECLTPLLSRPAALMFLFPDKEQTTGSIADFAPECASSPGYIPSFNEGLENGKKK